MARNRTATRHDEPCLPSPADKPPSGANWIHEIKHDGFRLMARRDRVGIRLITRRGNDWTTRYPLVAEAVNHLKVRSCLIDGELSRRSWIRSHSGTTCALPAFIRSGGIVHRPS
jgi:ATP-dependent DNA ligase